MQKRECKYCLSMYVNMLKVVFVTSVSLVCCLLNARGKQIVGAYLLAEIQQRLQAWLNDIQPGFERLLECNGTTHSLLCPI